MSIVGFAADGAQPALVQRIQADRGWTPNLFRVLLYSPPLADGWVGLANAFRGPCELDPRSREMAILLVAHLKDSAYEWTHHERVARSLGVSDREIGALRAWPERREWTTEDWALLNLVASTVLHETVGAEHVATLVRSGGERRVVEVAGLTAYYLAVSHFSAVMELEIDPRPGVPSAGGAS